MFVHPLLKSKNICAFGGVIVEKSGAKPSKKRKKEMGNWGNGVME
jgi:hypothetical protein